MSCEGEVWEDEDGVYLVLGRDPDHYDEWKVLLLADERHGGMHAGDVSWAGDRWFGSARTRRIA